MTRIRKREDMAEGKSFYIDGDEYKVFLSDERDLVSLNDRDSWGEISPRRQVINISKDLSPNQRLFTLLHESAHVFYPTVIAMLRSGENDDSQEDFCDAFARFVSHMIRDNQDIKKIVE